MLSRFAANGKLKQLWLDLFLALELERMDECRQWLMLRSSVPSRVAQCSSGPLPLEPHQIPWGLVSNSANKSFCTASPCAPVIQHKGGQMFKLEIVVFGGFFCSRYLQLCVEEHAKSWLHFNISIIFWEIRQHFLDLWLHFKSGITMQYKLDHIVSRIQMVWYLLKVNRTKHTQVLKMMDCWDTCRQGQGLHRQFERV